MPARKKPRPRKDVNCLPPEEEAKYTKAVIKAYKRAKKASIKNNERSKKIVDALNKNRAKMEKQKSKKRKKHTQSSITNF